MLPSTSLTALVLFIACLLLLMISLLLVRQRKKDNARINQLREDHDVLLKQQEEMNDTFRTVRAQRHDMMAHFGAIQYFIEEGQWEEGEDYLQKLLGEYEQTNLSLKGEDGHVASILYDTYKKASQQGIAIDYDLELPFSAAPMATIDQSKLLSNLLSNARHAAEEFTTTIDASQPATLYLSTLTKSGLFIIEVVNSSAPISDRRLGTLYHQFDQTIKGGSHEGLGTFVIAQIVEKYHGSFDYSYAYQEFRIKIKLPLLTS